MNGEILEFLSDINRVAVVAGSCRTSTGWCMVAGTMVETGENS